MPHYGTLHDFAFNNDVDDIRGTVLYGATDQKLGEIEDVIFDHNTGQLKYAVVDTGGWFTHKRFLVPAERIRAHDKDENAFQIDLAKEDIERKFPRFDEASLKSEKDWGDYERDYRRAWSADPVQHREDRLDLDVTPASVEPEQTTGPGIPMGSLGEEIAEPNSDQQRFQEPLDRASLTPQRLAGKFPETIQSSDKLHMAPAHVPGRTNDQARVASERVPDRAWQDDPTGSNGRQTVGPNLNNEFPVDAEPPRNPERYRSEETGKWHPRMTRFEEVLRKNRVDITASCPSCGPANDKEKAA